jgi:hydrogenase nickel incorporation protein HypA/HybF
MHELSIAMNIIGIAEDEAKKAGAISINKITIEVGQFSGVEMDALQLAMSEAVRDTALENAATNIVWVKAVAGCQECCQEFDPEDFMKICPFCNSLNTYFISGKELYVQSMEIET